LQFQNKKNFIKHFQSRHSEVVRIYLQMQL